MSDRIRINESDRMTISGKHLKLVKHTDDGIILEHVGSPGATEGYSYSELRQLFKEPNFRFERGYYTPCESKNRAISKVRFLSELPTAVRDYTLWKLDCCLCFLALEAAGRARRTEGSIKAVASEFRQRVLERNERRQRKRRAKRATDKATIYPIPCEKSVLRWVSQYEQGGCRPLALVSRTFRAGNRSQRFGPEEEDLIARFVDTYAIRNGPSKAQVARDALHAFKSENKLRASRGQRQLNAPKCTRTIERRIEKLDPYFTCAQRKGADSANRKFALIEQGIPAQFPMERVELDEWQIDLISLLTTSGALDAMDPSEREAVERGRRWICLALDCATRCVVGMRLTDSPSSEDAIAVLSDATTDKSALAASVGCRSAWNHYGGLTEVVADQGAAFVSERFYMAVLDLGGMVHNPPAGLPKLRGRIERLFRTFAVQLMPLLSGRTFSNSVERGDHPSEEQACLSDDVLFEILVRFVVDVYHNEPHAGLNGETPANCWKRLAEKFGVTAHPCPHSRRVVFGAELTPRKVSGKGIRIFGIDYACRALQDAYLHHRRREFAVRIDPADLGYASVLIDDTWHTVPAVQQGFKGVSLNDWECTAKNVRLKNAAEAALDEDTVYAALRSITEKNSFARQTLAISPLKRTAAQLDRLHDQLFVGLSITTEDDFADLPQGDGLFDGVIDTNEPAQGHSDDDPSTDDNGTAPSLRSDPPIWRIEED